jgi:hypothetical protein
MPEKKLVKVKEVSRMSRIAVLKGTCPNKSTSVRIVTEKPKTLDPVIIRIIGDKILKLDNNLNVCMFYAMYNALRVDILPSLNW